MGFREGEHDTRVGEYKCLKCLISLTSWKRRRIIPPEPIRNSTTVQLRVEKEKLVAICDLIVFGS